ncbi:MAG: phenylalanine--tRNA ligase subunit beta [Alicyclobacillus sp.]|nr:phenylalanine--tRNA ligase subunit beta [Alicyclobacillus sp.]
MKVSYQWLCEVVDIRDVAPEALAARLTSAGLAVDAVEPRVQGIRGVVVGEVVACAQHPNADRLKVCEVRVSEAEAPLTIVCGAPNVAAGQRVPVATVGAMLPGGPIGRARLRGVESCGMLCSAAEIGLETRLLPKEQTEGLYILPADAPIGADVVAYLHLDDVVLDIDLTPNRSDCLSIRGLAYEIAALYGREVRLAAPSLAASGQPSPVTVRLETDGCPRYDARVLEGLNDGPSPIWMQMRLLAMGVRPIGCIVDVTNYVMLEWGQPLHAFDLDQVHDRTIVVRQAEEGEELVTLDGIPRRLSADTIVIADPDRAIGIAGVMGGANSEIRSGTRRVILESAVFHAASVRRTGQRLGLRSEAQQRFEKGVDPVAVRAALDRAASLYTELAGGMLVGDAVSVRRGAPVDAEGEQIVEFDPLRCRGLLGADVADEQILQVFDALGFTTDRSSAVWRVTVPTRRPDITREADLVEEVARMVGYDQIPSTLPQGATTAGVLTRAQQMQRVTRHTLVGCGMMEVFTYAFTHPSQLDALRIAEDDPLRRTIPLARPMSDDRTVLRTHLLPSLAQVAAYNLAHGNPGAGVFEIARVYVPNGLPLTEQPEERVQWAGLWFGQVPQRVGERARPYDFFDAKGVIEAWLEALGCRGQAEFQRTEKPWYHPGRSAEVVVDGRSVGTFGQLHPQTAEHLDVPANTLYAEFGLEKIAALSHPTLRVNPLPRFPMSLRDLAVVVRSTVAVADLVHAAKAAADRIEPGVLESCQLFDVYRGAGIPEGKVSLAFSFVYRAADRTLTDAEVTNLEHAVLDAWKDAFQAELRQ